MKIGIAVTTTPSRPAVFEQWYKDYAQNTPEIPLYIHNDWNYKGVGYSKNKCLERLSECDYIFLFDDDCFIMQTKFYQKYINSGLEHACYTFDRAILSQHKSYTEFEKPNGCMLFLTRNVLYTVGGWDREFKGYGYEHCNFSDRVFNNGLTPARYIDIPNSEGLFKMADCESSFTYEDRISIPTNYKLYMDKFYSKEFIPFK